MVSGLAVQALREHAQGNPLAAERSGGKIAFARLLNEQNWEIYKVNGDGSDAHRLTHNPASDGQPAFSPNGRKIAFASTRRDRSDICVMRTNGTHIRRLTRDRHVLEGRGSNFDGEPAFSPNGKRIAFVSDRKGFPNIFVMRADGSSQHQLTQGLGFDSSPSFSPDGRRIAFSSSPLFFPRIFTMRSDGSRRRQLTRGGFTYDPAFSPVAPEIAYARDARDVAGDIWLMRSDGSRNHALTSSPQDETRPAFSPDGESIAFEKEGDIYTMNADGSTEQRVTHASAMDVEPSWGIRP